jgi:hypothetical protein
MAVRQDPSKRTIVRESDNHPFEWYSEDCRAYLTKLCDDYLDNSFGYDYHDWSRRDILYPTKKE